MSRAPDGFLAEMIASSRARVAAAREHTPLAPPQTPPAPGRLRAALERPSERRRRAAAEAPDGLTLGLIAEIKRRSPSKGVLHAKLNAVALAMAYAAAGADAISVLTEPDRFGGSLTDLREVAAAVDLPVLRKDFIVDEYQVWEAAAAGAAAVLLIAAALRDRELGALIQTCEECGLDALVEVHDRADLRRAQKAGATLVGVNNRDLRSLEVDLTTTEELVPAMDPGAFPISESGILTASDARRVAAAGARAILVGEALVKSTPADMPRMVTALKHPEEQP